jgi:hypothetical protein
MQQYGRQADGGKPRLVAVRNERLYVLLDAGRARWLVLQDYYLQREAGGLIWRSTVYKGTWHASAHWPPGEGSVFLLETCA